jgi:hypothetical protein
MHDATGERQMSAVEERIEEVHRHAALMAHAVLRDAVMWHWREVEIVEAAQFYIRASNLHAGSQEWREKVRPGDVGAFWSATDGSR